MSATDESKTAGVTATEGGYPAAGEEHGHAGHGEGHGNGEGHAHGDGHDCCGEDHGSGDHGHSQGGHGGHGGHGDGEDDAGEAPDMAGLEAMMGGMGGGEGGAGGMDMSALMAMLGKGGGKGGGGGGGMDMASMMGGMGGMGGKGGGKGGGDPPEDTDEKKGEKWVWMQKGEEVHIRFPLDPPCTSKKDVSVTFKSNTLKVAIRGESTIDGTLGGKVDVDDCTWVLSPEKDELQVMLTKVEGKTDAWRDLLA